jgi:predicted outer membrane repeat protein
MGIFYNVPLSGVTISGNSNFRLFYVRPGGNLTLVGIMTLENGNAAGNSSGRGGAIANLGTLSVYSVTFAYNQATDGGGAIYSTGPSLSISQSRFFLNQTAGTGGALFIRDGFVSISGTEISKNTAASGGGIYNNSPGSVGITSGTNIEGNNATGVGFLSGRGGGIYTGPGTFLYMNGSFLDGNTSVSEGGGCFSRGNVQFQDVSIQGNRATDASTGKGGGVYVRSGTTELISGCLVVDNYSEVPMLDGTHNSGLIWADPDATLIPNIGQNDIRDGIDFDSNPR